MLKSLGQRAKGERLKRIQDSPNFRDGIFQNPVETKMDMPFKNIAKTSYWMFKKQKERVPGTTLKSYIPDFKNLAENEINIIWFGHSTIYMEINGVKILTDPVLTERASPFSYTGPKRFNYTNVYNPDTIPEIDIVLLSHDHYDHLDYKTIINLHPRVKQFIMPLGVGAHLEYWGVNKNKISEFDWWESVEFNNITFTATPTRHFSGRSINDRFKTLWAGWAIKYGNNNLFFGGDSGYFPGFKDIAERLGPFKLVMLENAAYSVYWHEIHMMPEECFLAFMNLNAEYLMPVHWGKFDLSLHHWTEPIERLFKAAGKFSDKILSPELGKAFTLNKDFPQDKWWEEYK